MIKNASIWFRPGPKLHEHEPKIIDWIGYIVFLIHAATSGRILN